MRELDEIPVLVNNMAGYAGGYFKDINIENVIEKAALLINEAFNQMSDQTATKVLLLYFTDEDNGIEFALGRKDVLLGALGACEKIDTEESSLMKAYLMLCLTYMHEKEQGSVFPFRRENYFDDTKNYNHIITVFKMATTPYDNSVASDGRGGSRDDA